MGQLDAKRIIVTAERAG